METKLSSLLIKYHHHQISFICAETLLQCCNEVHISVQWEMGTSFPIQFPPLLTATVKEHVAGNREAKPGSSKVLKARKNS